VETIVHQRAKNPSSKEHVEYGYIQNEVEREIGWYNIFSIAFKGNDDAVLLVHKDVVTQMAFENRL
jgi:hypothetical protein